MVVRAVLKETCTKGVKMTRLSSRQPTLVRYLRCPELMDRMMERVGLAPVEAACVDGGLAWLEARTKCIFCRHVGECCSWLEGYNTRTTPADFCPNISFFESCTEHSSAGADVSVDAELMPRRLQQMGVDPAYIEACRTSTYQDLERVCASCKSRRLCARDLAGGKVEPGMQNYCPNAPAIDALVVNWVL